jgi:NAD(P)-dependent dehydrogenase (short-subunit alcohol dehydrogenase family)
LELARHGGHVVMACRDATRGDAARQRVADAAPQARVNLVRLDLSDLSSIRACAAELANAYEGIDVLINNAGVMAIPRAETADGFEMQFGTNHLGHFALTGLVMPLLVTRPVSRVVTVSSHAALFGRMHFHDLQGRRSYSKWPAYAQSKVANQLFTFELDRRARAAGLKIISVAAHPGYSATNLGAGTQDSILQMGMKIGDRLLAQSDAAGALPTLFAACDPSVQGGQYFGPDRLFGMRGRPAPAAPAYGARDLAAAARLWEISEELTGVTFPGLKPAA